jgi:hypothetical protein
MMFFRHSRAKVVMVYLDPAKNCTSQLDISDELMCAPKLKLYSKVAPREVGLRAHKPFGASPPRFRFWTIRVITLC